MTIGKILQKLKKLCEKAKDETECLCDSPTQHRLLKENEDYLLKIEETADKIKSFQDHQKNYFLKP